MDNVIHVKLDVVNVVQLVTLVLPAILDIICKTEAVLLIMEIVFHFK